MSEWVGEFEFEWTFYALSASKAIFRAGAYSHRPITHIGWVHTDDPGQLDPGHLIDKMNHSFVLEVFFLPGSSAFTYRSGHLLWASSV